MRKKYLSHISIFLGVLFLMLGFQLRVVETYVLSAPATRALFQMSSKDTPPPKAAIQRFAVKTTSPHKTITPPSWIGWASLSIGSVLLVNGMLSRNR